MPALGLSLGLAKQRAAGSSIAPPSAISGLVGWMTAKDLIGVVNDGDPVATWTDKTATGNATAAGAARPVLDADGLNGLPTLLYTAGNSLTFARTVTGGAFTVFGVVKPTNNVALRLWSHNSAGASGTKPYFGIDTSGRLLSGAGTDMSSIDAVEIDNGYIHAVAVGSSPSTRKLIYGRTTVRTSTGNFNYVSTNLGHASTFQWLGGLSEYVLFNRLLTDNEISQVLAYLESEWDALHNYILCDGDSLTFGTGSTPGNDYPSALRNAISSRRYTVKNYGTGGHTIAGLTTGLAATVDLYAPRIGTQGGKNIHAIRIGINDLAQGRTPTQVKDDIETLCLLQQGKGLAVCICTIANSVSATQGDIDDVNAFLRSDWQTFADYLADLQADPSSQDTGDTDYFTDGTHRTDAGYLIDAQIVQAAIGL